MSTKLEGEVWALLLLCLLSSCRSEDEWNKTIHVAPNGTDSIDCGSESKPCSLDFALGSASNSTRIELRRGNYNLSSSFKFTRISNFAIVGVQDVEVNCSGNSSLAFLLTENIVIEGIEFHQCGSWHPSLVVYPKNVDFIGALYFNYCKNLRLTRVQVNGTAGLGLTLYNVGGMVNISESVFSENRSPEVNRSAYSNNTVASGGGIYFELAAEDDNPTSLKPPDYASYWSNNVVVIEKSNFSHNVAPKVALGEQKLPSVPFTRGGGVGIFLAGSSSNNSFRISSCEFRQNFAGWGGGLQVEFADRSQNNNLSIEDTLFDGNEADLAGGGARIGTLIKVDGKLQYNNIHVAKCVFRNNTAKWGGGASVYGTTRPAPKGRWHISKVAEFLDCGWYQNRGLVGSAIGAYLVNLNEDDIGPRVPFHLELSNCNISDNVVMQSPDDVEVGQGAIYTVEVPVILKGLTLIRNNTKTAMVLDTSTLEVGNRVHFEENSGYNGGALALYGRSKVLLLKNSSLVFVNNTADERGGAMYVHAPGSPLVNFNTAGLHVHACFFAYDELEDIDYDKWWTEVVFKGNSAPPASGKSVFATTLKSCIRAGETRGKNTALQWRIIKFQDPDANTTDEVVTDAIDIRFNKSNWQVAPNQKFNASVRLIDEKGNDVNGMVHISVAGANLATPSDLFLVENSSVTYLKFMGNVGETFNVSIRTVGNQIVSKEILNVTLRPCNPGFKFQNPRCVCASDTNDGISRCKKNGVGFYLQAGYWAGMVDGKFVTNQCPENYCKCPNSNNLTNECEIDRFQEGMLCQENRSGILCGKCVNGHSVLLGSEGCGKCSDLYLLVSIPYAIILFALVMLVMLINLDAFTGYLNAWLYSYQVMALLLNPGFNLDAFISFVIGLANTQLKVGGSCLMKNMDDADKLALLYVLPTYILLVVFILAKLVRAYPNWCYSRRVKAPFRAFCTLFVLCYTDITGISLKILHPAVLKAGVDSRVVLFQDGEVQFFQGKHIGYGILAIVYVILVVIPFPLTLMFTPFFTKCLRPVFNLNNFKPVYDAFQSCFKDQYRWCSAFYFVARLMLLVLYTYMPSGYLKRILLESMCIFVLTVFVYLRPYKDKYDWLNKLDAVLLSNLALITIFSSGSDLDAGLGVVVKILSYVPLGYMFVLLAYGAYGYFKQRDNEAGGNAAQFKQLADEILTSED